jgi:hypothetical protein
VVDQVALEQVLSSFVSFQPPIIMPPLLRTDPAISCDSSDQAAHYHTLGHKLYLSLAWNLAGLGV